MRAQREKQEQREPVEAGEWAIRAIKFILNPTNFILQISAVLPLSLKSSVSGGV